MEQLPEEIVPGPMACLTAVKLHLTTKQGVKSANSESKLQVCRINKLNKSASHAQSQEQ